ncbi:LIM and SH3 domain protein 1 [Sparganum proliferum]
MSLCSACQKTVYPTEQLRCLDKLWHKQCFRCEVCRKVLGVHNCKGYQGVPYCSVHYPQFKSFTPVIDTPEFQQAAVNKKNMSKVEYHRAYENSRGTKISVSDDPVTRNRQQVSKIVSNTGYAHPPGPPTAAYPAAPIQPETAPHGGSWQSETVAYPTLPSSTVVTNQTSIGFTNGNSYKSNDLVERPVNVGELNYNGATGSGQKASWEPMQPEASKNEPEPIEFSPPKLILLGGLRVTGSGMHFQAVYDYEANDSDEVSFKEGDEILHGEPIDDGWMYGTVKRTGKFGMLPSNYVVPIQNPNPRS